jgi:uncharacterized protein (TIGR00661 family)
LRIVYGIHGYGRGHAMRASAVLPELARKHELLVLAGADAYHALNANYSVVRIPTIGYLYRKSGRISHLRSLKHNLSTICEFKLGGPALDMICDVLREFRTDVVLTDSEGYTHRAAARLGIPRITFDHFASLVYSRPIVSGWDRLALFGNAFVYKTLYGKADRIIGSAFFEADPRTPGVCMVGPVIRQEVRQVEPTKGNHLLVYINQGEHEYTPEIEQSLQEIDCPVRVYGAPRSGSLRNLEFKPLSNQTFIEDLASCRAAFATSGNQLCGEVMHFGKPLLAMPIDCFEQRLNAQYVERMGFGMQVRRKCVNTEVLKTFLSRTDEFSEKAQTLCRDGAKEALEAIERFAGELTCGRDSTSTQKEPRA